MAEIKRLSSDSHSVLDRVAPGVFDNPLNSQLVAECLSDDRHHLVVALDQGVVIGFVSGVHYVHPDKPAEMFINEIGVAPGHQGQGVGKATMQELLRYAERLGCREAWVLTNRTNHAAMRLFAATGGEHASHDQVMFTFFPGRNR